MKKDPGHSMEDLFFRWPAKKLDLATRPTYYCKRGHFAGGTPCKRTIGRYALSSLEDKMVEKFGRGFEDRPNPSDLRATSISILSYAGYATDEIGSMSGKIIILSYMII